MWYILIIYFVFFQVLPDASKLITYQTSLLKKWKIKKEKQEIKIKTHKL